MRVCAIVSARAKNKFLVVAGMGGGVFFYLFIKGVKDPVRGRLEHKHDSLKCRTAPGSRPLPSMQMLILKPSFHFGLLEL